MATCKSACLVMKMHHGFLLHLLGKTLRAKWFMICVQRQTSKERTQITLELHVCSKLEVRTFKVIQDRSGRRSLDGLHKHKQVSEEQQTRAFKAQALCDPFDKALVPCGPADKENALPVAHEIMQMSFPKYHHYQQQQQLAC